MFSFMFVGVETVHATEHDFSTVDDLLVPALVDFGATMGTNIMSLVVTYDRYVPLVAFVIVATAVVLRSHKTEYDVMKPTMK